MFSKHNDKTCADLSVELNDELDWRAGTLKTLDHHLDICALAFEPVSGLLAAGDIGGVITIYGAPGVELRVVVSDRPRIKFLNFATSTLKLVCIDEYDRLHVWDLMAPGRPKLQNIMNYRYPVNCITLSPSHTHVFVALSNGEIKTYDLLCSRNSPYTVPNMWALYEVKMLSTGMSATPESGSQIPVELVIHPRDLNLLFVAYGGGVILSDLTARNTLRAYEHILPPGAPGGSGYHSPDLLTHRRPQVTALAVHPAGHFFAVGHADGSITFWATEDEDKPLAVRTLDEDGMHLVDADKLDSVLNQNQSKGQHSHPEREPIFKLAWSGFPNSSDPRGGETVLTVLGGLRNDELPGVTTLLLPAFNAPEPPSSPDTVPTIHPSVREAMQLSLATTNFFTYYTKRIAQDFLLIPRDNPHFNGSWDPVSILILSDGEGDTRALEAFQFPPPSFLSSAAAPDGSATKQTGVEEDDEALSLEIASTLESMKFSDDPRPLRLPSSLWNGTNGVISGSLLSLSGDVYEVLLDNKDAVDDAVKLDGGVAWIEDYEGEMKLMKLQPRRILITHHCDLTIRFQDISSELLLSADTTPLQCSFPNPIPSLTIDLVSSLADPAIATRHSPTFIDDARIESVHLASESLECASVLQSGDVLVHRLIGGDVSTVHTDLPDTELGSLQHIPPVKGRRFHPHFILMPGRGPVASCALSDIGFLAVSYQDGSLFVVDMRGPNIILRILPDTKAHTHSFLHKREADPISLLTWTVSGTASDPKPRILLIATRSSGSAIIYAVTRASNGSWAIVKDSQEITEAISNPVPGGSVMIDSKTGARRKANRSGLAAVLGASDDYAQRSSIWVSAGAKGVRCVVDINGEKIGRADWVSKAGRIERVEVIHKSASSVLVAFTDKRQALVYSLPFLELMHSLQLEQASSEPLTPDDTGDYIEWVRHRSGLISAEKYGTLFNVRRSGPYEPPRVNFADDKRVVPPQPQPVSVGPPSLLSSFMGYIISRGMTGEQVDALLAGPDRPIPQPAQRKGVVQDTRDSGGSMSPSAAGIDARGIASSAANTASDLYSRLGSALSERGEMLGQLQESFDSLEQGSRRMVQQTKTMAARQTAKGWFGF